MADTIPSAKRAFLSSQVRVLSAPLAEPENWRNGTRLASDEDDIPTVVVDDVLSKVNGAIRKHNTRSFPPAALSHVAAQIDALYLASAPGPTSSSSVRHTADSGRALGVLTDGTVLRGADLTTAEVLAALPETWPDEEEEDDEEEDGRGARPAKKRQKRNKQARVSALESYSSGRDYEGLLERLRELGERREAVGRKRRQVERLREMMAPLENPAASVQPNLVSAAGRGKAGELEAEMERMKRLAERAGAAVEGVVAE